MEENEFSNVFWKTAVIFPRPQCVNENSPWPEERQNSNTTIFGEHHFTLCRWNLMILPSHLVTSTGTRRDLTGVALKWQQLIVLQIPHFLDTLSFCCLNECRWFAMMEKTFPITIYKIWNQTSHLQNQYSKWCQYLRISKKKTLKYNICAVYVCDCITMTWCEHQVVLDHQPLDCSKSCSH